MTDVTKDDGKIYLPIKFWFSGRDQKTKEKLDVISSKINNIVNNVSVDDSIEKLFEALDTVHDYQSEYNSLNGGYFRWPIPIPFKTHIAMVDDLIKKAFIEQGSLYFDETTSIVMTEDEICNGYKLYNSKDNFCVRTFHKFKELYEDTTSYTYNEFKEKFDEIACYDWAKQQPDGVCFGKYYDADVAFASQLTWEWNCQELFNLPYSKELILYTVEFGCPTRLESVRYSNFICEWTKRKIDLLQSK